MEMVSHGDFPPIESWPGQVFNFENSAVYDVHRAVQMITNNPQEFLFGMVKFSDLRAQIENRGHIDASRLSSMTQMAAWRPLLIATEADGACRLIDGYHRASFLMANGEPGMPTWILSREQTKQIVMPYTDDVPRI